MARARLDLYDEPRAGRRVCLAVVCAVPSPGADRGKALTDFGGERSGEHLRADDPPVRQRREALDRRAQGSDEVDEKVPALAPRPRADVAEVGVGDQKAT
ncbi:hypothetical protein [Streptomyces longispororuber]|uniref:hypothetical protein n=1 Tax=Streptomyces longispororuber TaxID=68230 RepID=UPI00210BA7C7|nr:hypothetical protein [Streptomyces longispororuber]MCQ4212580.1 hypothetical protein [Streptomyces longispororuber]